jgi:hypothetical protein
MTLLTETDDRLWIIIRILPHLIQGSWYTQCLFAVEQLAELRKVTLAGLLCSNVPGLEEVQSQVFVQEDPYL